MRTIEGASGVAGLRVAVIVSKYNDFVTDRLQSGAVAALAKAGVPGEQITILKVPSGSTTLMRRTVISSNACVLFIDENAAKAMTTNMNVSAPE